MADDEEVTMKKLICVMLTSWAEAERNNQEVKAFFISMFAYVRDRPADDRTLVSLQNRIITHDPQTRAPIIRELSLWVGRYVRDHGVTEGHTFLAGFQRQYNFIELRYAFTPMSHADPITDAIPHGCNLAPFSIHTDKTNPCHLINYKTLWPCVTLGVQALAQACVSLNK